MQNRVSVNYVKLVIATAIYIPWETVINLLTPVRRSAKWRQEGILELHHGSSREYINMHLLHIIMVVSWVGPAQKKTPRGQ